MHIHTVFFWLVETTTPIDRKFFEGELGKLTLDSNILGRHVGTPARSAMTDRDVVDGSYDYGMTLRFEDSNTHDRYQVSDVHEAFLKNCKHMFQRVQVYDVEEIL